jgi:hypothetical protein
MVMSWLEQWNDPRAERKKHFLGAAVVRLSQTSFNHDFNGGRLFNAHLTRFQRVNLQSERVTIEKDNSSSKMQFSNVSFHFITV